MSYNFNQCNCNNKSSCHPINTSKNECKHHECNDNKNCVKEISNDKPCDCYKKALRESLELLSKNPFNNYVNFSSFTLYGQSYSTAKASTTLKSIVSCNSDLIEYNDGSQFNTASLCDLVGFCFQLLNPTTNLPLFLDALEDYLCHCKGREYCPSYDVCPQSSCSHVNCNRDCNGCCCNDGKAAKLKSLLGPVNLYVSGSLGAIIGANLLAVVDDIVWVYTTTTSGSPAVTTTSICAIPLYNIEFLG